jgi:DNA-binding NarL/FixJ family response regulator
MRISEPTVKKHVSQLLRRFDAANRAELAAKAIDWHVVSRPASEP